MVRIPQGHIAWSKAHSGRHRFDLAESGIAAPDLEAMGLPSRATFPREGYAALPRLEASLGARLQAPRGQVLVTAGASEANAVVFAALLEPGDEVLAESPGYEPHRAVAALFGARVRTFPRDPGGEATDLAGAIEKHLGPATRMAVISDLHNPSGAELSERDVVALTDLAERRGLWLLCDETFRDASRRPLATASTRSPRWVATSSLTKAYGLGALRIGWIAGSGPVLDRCMAAHDALTVQPSLLSVTLALDLVPHLDALRARTHSLLAENHALWNGAARRLQALTCALPARGTTTWCTAAGDGLGDAFAEFAGERFDLAVTPGRFFGDPRGVRIGLGDEPARFAAALATLERAAAAFAAAGAPVGERMAAAPPLPRSSS